MLNKILLGDAKTVLADLPDNCVNTCVTSPPYYKLRDYGVDGQIGLEQSPEEYIERLVDVFREVKRVLNDNGTLWVNIGDSYNGSGKASGDKTLNEWKQGTNPHSTSAGKTNINGLKPKDMIGIPWMLAFALRADGWYLRQDIIWHKPNCMPESVKDRCTNSHEYIFLLSKNEKYFFDYKSISEKSIWFEIDNRSRKGPTQSDKSLGSEYKCNKQGVYSTDGLRNKRSVWTVNTKPLKENHFATFPQELIVDCIKAGCPEEGCVLDPFMGSGTTGIVARKLNRKYLGIELNPSYLKIAEKRILKELGFYA